MFSLIFSPSLSEDESVLVGRDHLMFSLSLPISALRSGCSLIGSSRRALILITKVSNPWPVRSRKSCTISLIVSASGFPHVEGDLPFPDHIGMEQRR